MSLTSKAVIDNQHSQRGLSRIRIVSAVHEILLSK
jgi:hypothetical protein